MKRLLSLLPLLALGCGASIPTTVPPASSEPWVAPTGTSLSLAKGFQFVELQSFVVGSDAKSPEGTAIVEVPITTPAPPQGTSQGDTPESSRIEASAIVVLDDARANSIEKNNGLIADAIAWAQAHGKVEPAHADCEFVRGYHAEGARVALAVVLACPIATVKIADVTAQATGEDISETNASPGGWHLHVRLANASPQREHIAIANATVVGIQIPSEPEAQNNNELTFFIDGYWDRRSPEQVQKLQNDPKGLDTARDGAKRFVESVASALAGKPVQGSEP